MRFVVTLVLIGWACGAEAYIGPGAGISFLGSIWAILIGVVLALVALLTWPARLLWRRMRRRKGGAAESRNGQ
jgi:hypothetical protein